MTLTRLECLSPTGWEVVLKEVDLLHPERFPARLRAKGKFGRAIVLAPGGKVYRSQDVPADPSVLRETTEGFWPWKLPSPELCCPACGVEHPRPHDGRCLL